MSFSHCGEFRFGSILETSGTKLLNSALSGCGMNLSVSGNSVHAQSFRIFTHNPFACTCTAHPHFRCVSLCVAFSCGVHAWFSFCFACAAVFAFAFIFSLLRSRSQSLEGDEQLGEVHEEEEGERAGEGVGRKGSGGKVDTDKEHRQDMVEKEEDLYPRSISDTDLR